MAETVEALSLESIMISRQSSGGNGSSYDKFDMQDIAVEKFRKFATDYNVHVTLVGGAYSLSLDPGRYIIVEQVSDQSADWRESPDDDTASVNSFDSADLPSPHTTRDRKVFLQVFDINQDVILRHPAALLSPCHKNMTPGVWDRH